MGVAGANMQWGNFVCPSSSQKRESTAFTFEELGDFRVLVSKVVKAVLNVGKGAKFGSRESEQWPKIYAIESPVLETGKVLNNKPVF